jgi:hypothetical protein
VKEETQAFDFKEKRGAERERDSENVNRRIERRPNSPFLLQTGNGRRADWIWMKRERERQRERQREKKSECRQKWEKFSNAATTKLCSPSFLALSLSLFLSLSLSFSLSFFLSLSLSLSLSRSLFQCCQADESVITIIKRDQLIQVIFTTQSPTMSLTSNFLIRQSFSFFTWNEGYAFLLLLFLLLLLLLLLLCF